MKTEILADVRADGTLSTAKRMEAHRAFLAFAGKRIRITVERLYNKRSNAQNRYFHGVCLPIIQQGLLDIGYNEARDMAWVKDFVKANLLTVEVADSEGVVRKAIRQTSGLSKSEFMDFIADLQQWGSQELGVYIPDPNEQVEMGFCD